MTGLAGLASRTEDAACGSAQPCSAAGTAPRLWRGSYLRVWASSQGKWVRDVPSRRVAKTAQLKETAWDMLVPSRSAPGGVHPGRRPVGGHDAHGSPRGRAPALLPPRLAASPRITFAEPSVSARLGGGPGVWTAQDRLGGRARRQAVCRRPLSPCDTS